MTTENVHYDSSTNQYKIFKLSNSNGDYYVSYTKQKYLTRVMENFKRKKTDTFAKLFNGDNIKIELLEIVKSENVYFIKNKINDYIAKEDQKHNVKNKEQVEQAEQEQVEQETDKKLIECKVCNCKVSYANFARHKQSKKHLRKICD
jgi:hypothetical protein